MTLQEQIRSLVHMHHESFLKQIASVARLLDERDAAGSCLSANIIEAEGIAHQMKGTAGSMGFAELGAAAADLDESLKAHKDVSGPVAAAQMARTLELLAVLRDMAERTTPEMSTLYNADLSQLTR